jgi:hypothetical protein
MGSSWGLGVEDFILEQLNFKTTVINLGIETMIEYKRKLIVSMRGRQ